MSLTHVTIPVELLSDQNLCEVKRVVLSLVIKFHNKSGLKISDGELARIMGKSRQWISKCINELEAAGYIRINKKKSKYRTIYCQENTTVKGGLLSTIIHSTVNFNTQTSQLELTHNIIKENNNSGGASEFSYVLKSGQNWNLAQEKIDEYKNTYTGIDVEAELRKAGQWLLDNPSRRKTAKGMHRFLSGWLSRTKPEDRGQIGTRELTEEEADRMLKGAGLI